LKIDLSCPVEVQNIEIAIFDCGAPRAYLRLYNLADKTVHKLRAIAHWTDLDGNIEDLVFVASPIDAPAHSEFSLSLSPDTLYTANALEIEFLRIRFKEEADDWIAVEGARTEIPEAEPITGPEEAVLLRTAGQGAVQFAQMVPGAWICVCGRANPLDVDQCIRCMRGRDTCLTRFTREAASRELPPLPGAVAKAPPEPTLPFDPNARETEKWEKLRSTRMRRIIALLILALILALLTFGVKRPSAVPEAVPQEEAGISDMQLGILLDEAQNEPACLIC